MNIILLNPMEELNFTQVCDRLGIAPYGLVELLKNHELAYLFREHQVFIPTKSLEEYLSKKDKTEELSKKPENPNTEFLKNRCYDLPLNESGVHRIQTKFTEILSLFLKYFKTEESELLSSAVFKSNSRFCEREDKSYLVYKTNLEQTLSYLYDGGLLKKILEFPLSIATLENLDKIKKQKISYKSNYADEQLIQEIEDLGYNFKFLEAIVTKGIGKKFLHHHKIPLEGLKSKVHHLDSMTLNYTLLKLVTDKIVNSSSKGCSLNVHLSEISSEPLRRYIDNFINSNNES